MTAPRIIPAAEAQALLEGATPGPWMHNWRGPEDGAPGDLWHTGGCGGPLTREADWVLAANAPDLAATVVALHAEVERLRSDDYAQARRIADAAIAAERARIVALLRERADATREHDGRESVVSASYRLAASLIVAKVTP